jgi:hypothetical protein
MLTEVVPTRQIDGEPRRVWYLDEIMDLIVWYSPDDQVLGFQLTSDKGTDEHALTWFAEKGFAHDRVDDGEGHPGHYKMTPILLEDGVLDCARLVRQFSEKDGLLPAEVRELVISKLTEYGKMQTHKALSPTASGENAGNVA